MFGTPVELLVTDKSAYTDSGTHWRRAEARHIARRVLLVDSGAATAGQIVVLFAAGTDAEWYEEELREAGLPTHRATGRGYFGQQQVADVLAYLRLLHNRYDDEALVTILASPSSAFRTTVSCCCVAPRRGDRCSRESSAVFRRISQLATRSSSARSCALRAAGVVVGASAARAAVRASSPHDYDLAVLAQWDGRRRYANLRKLARSRGRTRAPRA